jgi:hypothetical protein
VIRSLGRPLATLLLVLWSALLWWLLTSTRVTSGVLFPGSVWFFNLGHAGVFGIHALLVALVLRAEGTEDWLAHDSGGRAPFPRWVAAALVALAYSGVLEIRQGFIVGRSASWADMLTNGVGAFGAPWALAAEQLFSRRLAWVLSAGCVTAGVATWTPL